MSGDKNKKSFAAQEDARKKRKEEKKEARAERKKGLGEELRELHTKYFAGGEHKDRPSVMTLSGIASVLERGEKVNSAQRSGLKLALNDMRAFTTKKTALEQIDACLKEINDIWKEEKGAPATTKGLWR